MAKSNIVTDEDIVDKLKQFEEQNGELNIDDIMNIVSKYRIITPGLRVRMEEVLTAHNEHLISILNGSN